MAWAPLGANILFKRCTHLGEHALQVSTKSHLLYVQLPPTCTQGQPTRQLFQLLWAPNFLFPDWSHTWRGQEKNTNIWIEYIVIGSFWFCISPQALIGRRQKIHKLFPVEPKRGRESVWQSYISGTAQLSAKLIITFTGDAVKWVIIHSFCAINAGQLNPGPSDITSRTQGQSIMACLCTTEQN